MKKTALIVAVATLMSAAPAAAHGYLGLNYGSVDLNADDGDLWRGEGEFGWNSGSWGGQAGGSYGNLDFSSGAGEGDFYTLNGHLYWQGGSWRLGGVVATSQLDDLGNDEWTYGVEGMFNIGPNSNLFGSLTVGSLDSNGGEFDVWNLDVGANFYFNPNARIGGFVGTGNVSNSGFDEDTTHAGINGEFQPWSAPVSFTLGYNYYEFGGFETNAFQIGARWNFGGGTMQDRNNEVPFTARTGFADPVFGIQ